MGTGDRPARGCVEPAPGTRQPPGPHDLYCGPTNSRVLERGDHWRGAALKWVCACRGVSGDAFAFERVCKHRGRLA